MIKIDSNSGLNKPYNFYLLKDEPLKGKNGKSILFPGYGSFDTQEYLMKWSMKDGMKLQSFSFDKPFKDYLAQKFVHDFLANPSVVSSLEVQNSDRGFVPIGIFSETIEMKVIPCTLTSMDIFNRIYENEAVVRSSGSIMKCFEEYFSPVLYTGGENKVEVVGDSLEISDELRRMILIHDSENADLYSDAERDEFLFHIFQHLVIGGSLCQYEDSITPYLRIAKALYKDLVSVSRIDSMVNDSESKVGGNGNVKLQPTSTVVQVLSARCDSYSPEKNLLFHKPQWNNFFYLVIDPTQRIVKTFYHHY